MDAFSVNYGKCSACACSVYQADFLVVTITVGLAQDCPNNQYNRAKNAIFFYFCDFTALQKHFHHLEAVALERECVENAEDFTQPDVEMVEHRVGTLLDELSHMVFPSENLGDNQRQKRMVSF